MKKWMSLLGGLAVIFSLAACGGGEASRKTAGKSNGVSDVLESGMAAADSKEASKEGEKADPASGKTDKTEAADKTDKEDEADKADEADKPDEAEVPEYTYCTLRNARLEGV